MFNLLSVAAKRMCAQGIAVSGHRQDEMWVPGVTGAGIGIVEQAVDCIAASATAMDDGRFKIGRCIVVQHKET